jgi:hypothetical protein
VRNATDLLLKQFGRLLVTARAENSRHGAAQWQVWCDCGTLKTVRTDQLTKGTTTSCGCYAKEATSIRNKTHGKTNTFEFGVWTAMRKRCLYEKHPRYHRYGGRGIKICKRWEKFENFFADMGECPFKNGSIERVDNNKGYTPSNCKWLPKTEQSKNRNF